MQQLNYTNVTKVVVGKYFELELSATDTPVEQQIENMCTELLTNVNMESYRYEIEQLPAKKHGGIVNGIRHHSVSRI